MDDENEGTIITLDEDCGCIDKAAPSLPVVPARPVAARSSTVSEKWVFDEGEE